MHVELAFGFFCASVLVTQAPVSSLETSARTTRVPSATRTAPAKMAPAIPPLDLMTTPASATAPAAVVVAPVVAIAPEKQAFDRAQIRVEVEKSLAELTGVSDAELSATQKTLKPLWTKRLELLDWWDKAVRSHDLALHPSPSPEREASDKKAELERVNAQLELLKASPESAYVEAFKTPVDELTDAKLAQMRDALELAKANLKERTSEVEKMIGASAAITTAIADARADRDKFKTEKVGYPTRRAEAESKLFKAPTEDARKIARDEFINLKCEMGVAAERLALTEACIDLETRRLANCDTVAQAAQANLQLASGTLNVLTDRFKSLTERKRADLNREAKSEERKAETLDDPVEKFRAIRTAELLKIQSRILEDEKTLSTNGGISLEEQTSLADRAKADFADLQKAVKENKVSGLVALRLNNDFRRITRERATILRNELNQSAAANTYYENALTEAELAYFNDARDDKFERDAFIQTLPEARRPAANLMVDDLEKRHKEGLAKHRDVLQKLLTRAEDVHNQVNGRLKTLDAHYAFIRMNIFWVRDTEPLGDSTLPQARKDVVRLVAAVKDMAADPLDQRLWTHSSAEFGLAVFGLIVLPWPIRQIRKSIKAALIS